MRLLLALIALGLGGYGIWNIGLSSRPDMKETIKTKVEELLSTGHFHTLEVRYTANQIMEAHRKDLLKSHRHKYLEPILNFYPYLLLEVKYNRSESRTSEGIILWDLADGEIVLDTRTWEKTHGFGDCINANAQRNEFKVINVLAKKGGSLDRHGLSKALNVENDILDAWLESCRKKKLVVRSGNEYRLHLEKPQFKTLPETRIDERLVTKPFKNTIRVPKHYCLSQIEKIAKAAFGNEFAIRKTTDVYLPVHNIIVQNPDGSIHTSHWNALNGKPLSQKYYID